MAEMIEESSGMQSTTIGVYRTAATVKGGRRFSFGALVVVGNRNGQVGFGYGKSKEVPAAIEKAQKYAKKEMINLRRIGTTINHEVQGKYSASIVRLIPAAPGTGVVAGGVVRSILEMAGVSDCLSKCYGSTNARNVVKAVFHAIEQLRVPADVATLRGVTLDKTPIEVNIDASKSFMPKTIGEKARGPVNTIGQDRGNKGGRRNSGGGGGGGGRRSRTPQSDAPAGDAPGGAPASG